MDSSSQEISERLSELEERCKEFHFEEDISNYDEGAPLEERDPEEILDKIDELTQSKSPEVKLQLKDFSYYEEDIVSEYERLPMMSKVYSEFHRYDDNQVISAHLEINDRF